MLRIIIGVGLGMALSGCAALQEPQANDPYFAPLQPEVPSRQLVQNGSLFAQQYSNSLYSDNKARHEGDIITVVLKERTQASKNAKTETKKDSSASFDPMVGLGGRDISVAGNVLQFGANSASNYKGDAKADQSNSLVGDISVNVLQVLANGNLVIRGEKWLTLNTGKEYIRLTGVIRSQDVDVNNTVESTKIANARIEYSGTGAHHNGQSPGWLSRFFSSPLWPF
ncbi:MAG: flagellar basal body L-ring protein FlgH [Gammaproteobacteria bacterium]|nr:flagellar basal body L-ring protein FlgH [Gammaproteobacteria bacterium]MBU1554283.1 flagellar basal body L-ring protein FlgH [Gammaproteobacteria bacterium]MBU2069360.1 flagellar basal body L-ring protein FlgH [Gammaproteobacteria bacterium]MBU2183413.1 flagellar basal body L-ring protein FlgH [Gammaproteobacteria bacterium]MBU2204570.1 flagellar basal body L-ring protein FlgH [Gammaproteobacteria bacterium]